MRIFITALLWLLLATVGHIQAHTLQWDASEGAEHYQVYIRDAGADTWQELGDTIKGTSATIPDMAVPDKDYEFGVKAFNRWGNHSDMSNTVFYNELQHKPVLAPQNVRIVLDINVNVNINQ